MNGPLRGMADVQWSDAALTELIEIRAYIALFNPAAAERMLTRLIALGESLAMFPNRGRPAAYGTREMTTVPPYILNYEVVGHRVMILRVRHGARESN
jgi:plasmid stabilization system protein ParE